MNNAPETWGDVARALEDAWDRLPDETKDRLREMWAEEAAARAESNRLRAAWSEQTATRRSPAWVRRAQANVLPSKDFTDAS